MKIIGSSSGRGFRLEAAQFLPHPRDQVFEFFSDASNRQSLTPAWLHFSVVTPPPMNNSAGTLIEYRLRVHGVPLHWQSRISVWEPPLRFVDEQTHGPHRRWRHEHVFEAADGGTLCHDMVDYAVSGGSLINTLFVRPDLFKIFAFRQDKLRELVLCQFLNFGFETTQVLVDRKVTSSRTPILSLVNARVPETGDSALRLSEAESCPR